MISVVPEPSDKSSWVHHLQKMHSSYLSNTGNFAHADPIYPCGPCPDGTGITYRNCVNNRHPPCWNQYSSTDEPSDVVFIHHSRSRSDMFCHWSLVSDCFMGNRRWSKKDFYVLYTSPDSYWDYYMYSGGYETDTLPDITLIIRWQKYQEWQKMIILSLLSSL